MDLFPSGSVLSGGPRAVCIVFGPWCVDGEVPSVPTARAWKCVGVAWVWVSAAEGTCSEGQAWPDTRVAIICISFFLWQGGFQTGSVCVAQAGCELTAILLPQPSKSWYYRHCQLPASDFPFFIFSMPSCEVVRSEG